MLSMRSWIRSSERQLCAWKNLRREPRWACCNSSRVGQRWSRSATGSCSGRRTSAEFAGSTVQGSGETIAVAGFLVYQLAAFFYQEMQQAGLLGIRLQGAQRLTMAHQQIQQRSRVMGIALGTRRGECLAVVRCGSGVYREQHQVRGIWSKYRPQVRETAPDRRQWGGRRSAVADSPPRLQWLREGCPTLPLHTAGSRPAGAARNASGWPSQWLQTRPILVLPAWFSIIRTWGEPSFASEQGMVPTKFL